MLASPYPLLLYAAGKDYRRGEEVFTTYGDDCNARFQVGYGFAPNPAEDDHPCRRDLHARFRPSNTSNQEAPSRHKESRKTA